MTELKWWQSAVFYQVYPRSFADGNGDGIGDFAGLTSKLDYLVALGVTALWISPHFPSPMWDCGYDVSDYEAVAPEYGTLADFTAFLHACHTRGLRVILDLVLNHTSSEHPWFLESRSSRTNPKSDWYVWQEPSPLTSPPGAPLPPNNWQSCFDGPAWTYVPEREQYYYHYFMQQQPDLNWRNPQVKAAMWQAARFWLKLGVDGFRLDAIGTIFEDPAMTPHLVPWDLGQLRHHSDLATTPAEKEQVAAAWREMFKHQLGGPGLHDLMKELRAVVDEFPGDRLLIGEDDDLSYLGNGTDELHLVFNFPLMRTSRLTPAHIRANQHTRLQTLDSLPTPGWGCNTLGNHDCSRLSTAFGDVVHNDSIARLHLALLLTMRGTPFLYNGEEIGMTDLLITDPTALRDTMATWYYHNLVSVLKVPPAEAARRSAAMSRDKNRTPLQWRNAPNGGFSPPGISPWLPVNPNYATGVNVADQQGNPASLLTFYQQLIHLRQATPALVMGDYQVIQPLSEDVITFLRTTPSQKVLVVLNFSHQDQTLELPDLNLPSARLLFATPTTRHQPSLQLPPFGICLLELT